MRPQSVDSTLESKRTLRAEVSVKHLAIIPRALKSPQCPAGFDTHRTGDRVVGNKRLSNHGIAYARLQVLTRHTEFFSCDQREKHPAHESQPGRVIAEDNRTKWLLRDPFVKYGERCRAAWCMQAHRSQPGGVCRVGATAPGEECLFQFRRGIHHKWLDVQSVRCRVGSQMVFGGRVLLNAHRGTLERGN